MIRRGGLNFQVDLSEGIDFSVFLFGAFQKHIRKWAAKCISQDAVILDIGANIGTMTLPFAQMAVTANVKNPGPEGQALD